MSLKIDRVQLEIVIKNDQSRKRLRELEDQSRVLKKELKKLPQGTEEWTKKFNELKRVQSQMDGIIDKIGLTGLSLKELSSRQKELNAIMRNLDPRTNEYKKLDAQLIKVKARMTQLRGGAVKTRISLKRMADTVNRFAVMGGAAIATITGMVFSIGQLIKGTVGLDDALANVMKTTGLTRKEVREMYSDFRYLNTRTARKELLSLAEEAGRLGKKGKGAIMEFVDVGNKIKTALGDDLGDNADKAILEVGKITTLLKVAESQGVSYGRAMEMVGSAVNELAANSMAQAPYLINFTKRTMGLGDQAKMTAAELLGLGATFDEAGQNLELSATAVNKIVIDMFRDYADYAGVAGMKAEDFFKLLNKDANAAFIKLLEGLNGNNDGLALMVEKFDAIDVDGARATQALSALASKIDALKKNQALANKALLEGTSLTNEYNIKNNNLAGSYEKLGRYIRAKFINSSFLGWLENVIGKMAEWTVAPLSEKLKKDQISLNAMVIEMTSFNTSAERRNTLYEELGRIHPGILDGIDKENINVERLSMNLAKYNEQMIKKIALQDSEEALAEQREEYGMKSGERAAYEVKTAEIMARLVQETGNYDIEAKKEAQKIALSNLDIAEKFNKVLDIRVAAEGNGARLIANKYINQVSQLKKIRKEEADLQAVFENGLKVYQDMYSNVMGSDNSSNTSPFVNFDIEEYWADLETDLNDVIANFEPAEITLWKPKKEFDPKNLNNPEIQRILALSNQKIKAYTEANAAEITQLEANFQHEESVYRTEFNKRYRLLKGDQQAQKRLSEKFQKDELRRKAEHLIMLTAVLENHLKDGSGLEDIILSDEENAKLQAKLDEVKLALSEIGIEIDNLAPGDSSGLGEITEKLNKVVKVASAVNNAIGGIFSALSAKENAEMEQYEINMEKRKKSLEKQLADGAMSQEIYNDRVTELDENTDDKRKELANEQAKRDKTMAIFGALINTAQAVAAALTIPGIGIALAAVVGALGLYQVGVISKTKVPQYADGNYIDLIGANDGKNYRAKRGQNKTQLVNGPTFIPGLGLTGEGSKPKELVFSGDDSQRILNSPGLIDAINYTIRSPQFANGNYPSTVTNNYQKETFSDPRLINSLDKFTEVMERVERNGLSVPWNKINEKDEKMKQLKESVRIK